MAKIVLLSCTKSKLDHKAPAQELYSASPMFQKTLKYGESLQPDKMFILSAKHHLVPMNKELEPYDKTLKEMPADEKEQWGEETINQMKQAGLDLNKDKFIFLTGSEYMKPFEKYIPESNMEAPMAGKRMGERLKWLNDQISKLNELFKRVKNLINECLSK
jgi:basic membrane lipoprotein Med (substrate-binding protein (PBP1-ABC) superfamily)